VRGGWYSAPLLLRSVSCVLLLCFCLVLTRAGWTLQCSVLVQDRVLHDLACWLGVVTTARRLQHVVQWSSPCLRCTGITVSLQQPTGSIPDSLGSKHLLDTNYLHYAPLLGIGSGHRQLIAVTCIAEHA